MRPRPVINSRAIALATATAILGFLAPVASATQANASGVTVISHFVLTDDSIVSGDSAYLDNGATDFQPGDIVFMALNDTPGGVCGCASVTPPLGVWYDNSRSTWAVFTEDASSMPAKPSFNILVVPKATKSAFIVKATGSNTSGNHTFINSKLTNGQPRAVIQITQDYNPGGTLSGTNNDSAVGVRYFPAMKKWAIFNENGKPIPAGAAFNVLVGSSSSNGGKTAMVSVTPFDHKVGTIFINNPVSNGNPNNVTFVTQNYNPGGKGGVRDAHPLEVAYPAFGTGFFQEKIDNADFTTAPLHSTFNLLIFSS